MANMELIVDSNALQAAILKAPDKLEKRLNQAISRSVSEIARSARRRAPKAFSVLTNSINDRMVSPLEGLVAPGTNYAEAVEKGTGVYGPAGQASGKLPPVENILDWVRLVGIQPREPDMDQDDVAWLIARKIATTGTKPQPYLQPAYDENREKTERRINQAIDRAINETVGA